MGSESQANARTAERPCHRRVEVVVFRQCQGTCDVDHIQHGVDSREAVILIGLHEQTSSWYTMPLLPHDAPGFRPMLMIRARSTLPARSDETVTRSIQAERSRAVYLYRRLSVGQQKYLLIDLLAQTLEYRI